MKTHSIHWKSTVSGKIGTGTRLFEKEDAELLAKELNEDYPDIDHDAVIQCPPSAEPDRVAHNGAACAGEIRPARSPRQHVLVVRSARALIAARNEVLLAQSWENAIWFILAPGCLSALVVGFWL